MRASLERIVANRGFIEYTLDLLSIPEYVIKKVKTSWPQMWEKARRQRILSGHNLKKRCINLKFTGIHDRFLRDSDFRKSMLEDDRDEDVLSQMGRSCKTRFHLLNDRIKIFSIQTKLVDLSQ